MAGPFQEDLVVVDVVDEDFDIHPTAHLFRVSWVAHRVVGTYQEEDLGQVDGLPANHEVEARGIRTVPASPCIRGELHILVAGIVVVVACGHGPVAFHLAAFRQLCASCQVGERRSPP